MVLKRGSREQSLGADSQGGSPALLLPSCMTLRKPCSQLAFLGPSLLPEGNNSTYLEACGELEVT